MDEELTLFLQKAKAGIALLRSGLWVWCFWYGCSSWLGLSLAIKWMKIKTLLLAREFDKIQLRSETCFIIPDLDLSPKRANILISSTTPLSICHSSVADRLG